jgi:MHS family citrate/tricarballylate:H+ symporter-like MFS transporter
MFDFFLFGLYARPIAETFFPRQSEFAALMLTFATFGAGFLMRPLGAIILGAYVDKVGRRKGLVVTLSLMAVGTMLIGLVPGYLRIGVIAPLLVLLGRLLQGFSAGVELGGVSVYLAEMARPGHKGFLVAWQSASQQLSIIAATALAFTLNQTLHPIEIVLWGWRIPFLLGCALLPFLFYLRSSLAETPEFLARQRHPALREAIATLRKSWRLVLTGMLLVSMTTVSFYLITIYTPTFGSRVLNLSDSDSLQVTVLVALSNLFWLPLMGALSDRLGRRPLLLASTGLAILTAYPSLTWLAAAPSFTRMLGVELWLSFLYAGYNGALVVLLTEIMPSKVRTAGFSLAYSLATALFGGFTPAICTALIRVTGDNAAPGWWLSAAAGCGLLATLAIPSVVARSIDPGHG